MATEEVIYLSYAEAVFLHIELMHLWGEVRYGVFDRSLVESALARPQHAAVYDKADLIAQAATLCYGLIKNHPWVGGNKRTATLLVQVFLIRNRMRMKASTDDLVEMVTAVESDRWQAKEIEDWLRLRAREVV
ncbi:MAG: type II toxin-antitoxin system death-on-curing family toxin [Pyrinomonadaceae bacterium]